MTRLHLLSRRQLLVFFSAAALAPALLPFGSARAADRVTVLAASYPALLAARAALEGLEGFVCTLLTDAQMGCPHDYAMTPQERMKLESADVIVLNGQGYEAFLGKDLLAGLKGLVIDAGQTITPLESMSPLVAGHGHDHAHDEHGDGHNPHHFASPACFARMVRTVADTLAAQYPHCADKLAANAARCEKDAETFANNMAELADRAGAQDIHLILQHDTLSWFFAGTPFHADAVLQEGDAESPSAAVLLDLADTMKKSGRTYLLAGDRQFRSDVLDLLSRESGAALVLLDTLVSGPAEAGREYYFTTMHNNLAALQKALVRQRQ